jgi:hypothetical protein
MTDGDSALADASASRTPERERMTRLIMEYEKEDESAEDSVAADLVRK